MMDKQDRVDAGQQQAQTNSKLVNAIEERKQPPLQSPGWDLYQPNIFNKEVYLSEFAEERSHILVSLLGYGLLAFAFFDCIYILIPPRFTNPVWEFQTIGALVERAAIPLLGMASIFYRRQGQIKKLEKQLMGCLSWVCLLLGLFYLLMVPLGIVDSWRIYQAERVAIADQLSAHNQQLEQITTQLDGAKTNEQMIQILAKLSAPGSSPQIENPQIIKKELLNKMSQAQLKMKSQATKVDETKKRSLIKNSVKWNLGALLAGTLFVLFWHLTDWARIRED